jgi:hypothetical protein
MVMAPSPNGFSPEQAGLAQASMLGGQSFDRLFSFGRKAKINSVGEGRLASRQIWRKRQQLSDGAVAAAVARQNLKPTIPARAALSPEAPAQQLIDGNGRFGEGRMTRSRKSSRSSNRMTWESREPFAAVLS